MLDEKLNNETVDRLLNEKQTIKSEQTDNEIEDNNLDQDQNIEQDDEVPHSARFINVIENEINGMMLHI